MLLSMVGFLATLIIVGGLASLLTITQPDHSALTRYLSFTFL
jgi:hypothetical protein